MKNARILKKRGGSFTPCARIDETMIGAVANIPFRGLEMGVLLCTDLSNQCVYISELLPQVLCCPFIYSIILPDLYVSQ